LPLKESSAFAFLNVATLLIEFPLFSEAIMDLSFNRSFRILYSTLYRFAILEPGIFRMPQLEMTFRSFLARTTLLYYRIQNQILQFEIYINTQELLVLDYAEDLLEQSLQALEWLLTNKVIGANGVANVTTVSSLIQSFIQLLLTSGKEL